MRGRVTVPENEKHGPASALLDQQGRKWARGGWTDPEPELAALLISQLLPLY